MSSGNISATGAVAYDRTPGLDGRRYLYGPFVDFICMGGSSLILLPLLFLRPPEKYYASIWLAMFLLSNVINNPHFAHSYQIFYRNFGSKSFGADHSLALRVRYIVAGIVVPIAMAIFFAITVARGDVQILGYGGNAMAFFVGWHYVKQGYGMLMVDAALKKQFFQATDKKALLVNSYAVWILSWLNINVALSERNLFGLKYYLFPVPPAVLSIATAVVVVTSVMTLWVLHRRWKGNTGSLPYNGVVGYVASLYIWLLFVKVNPLLILVVPALHSLQYLAVVWRFETNYEKGQEDASEPLTLSLTRKFLGVRYRLNIACFIIIGCLVGFLGFFGLPVVLDMMVPYNKEIFGASMFMFIFWVFINVHHYFLDNVMWRRENPDTRRYLFG
ncbi:hypothetical protein [Bradyrhizobium sp. URHD0069]|uniref:hypothetical protein n=1 Tax=Bradyrhizobium sp. URHD0069 TaxID=1380355 RepID=UPI001FDA69A8|nr:hypothetical protein [Bradyrhizobium sp. URHD0069]